MIRGVGLDARWLVLPAVVVASLVPFACTGDSGPDEGEARLEVDGRAVVARADGDSESISDGTTLKAGDRVEVIEGTAEMELPGDVRFELRAAVDDVPNTAVTLDDPPSLDAGDLLVVTERPTSLAAAGTIASVEGGATRVSRHLGVSVGVYHGAAAIDSAGVERDVPALRRLSVPVLGRPAPDVLPLRFDGGDPWDRRFLGDAIALGERLEAMSRGYTASLSPGEGRTVGFYELVLPGLADEREFTQELLVSGGATRPPGETLVGAAISELGRRGSFADRWEATFGFRDDGAAWGLVALDQAVNGSPLLGTVEEALAASPFDFAQPTTTTSDGPGAPGTTAPPNGGSTPPTTSEPNSTTTTTTSGTTTTTTPQIGPIDDVTDPVEDLLDDLVNGGLGSSIVRVR